MAEQESTRTAIAAPSVVNFLSAFAPTSEGLLLVTTLDGKQGKILLRYHNSREEDVVSLCNWLSQKYAEGFRLL